jgi:hypothetical protein
MQRRETLEREVLGRRGEIFFPEQLAVQVQADEMARQARGGLLRHGPGPARQVNLVVNEDGARRTGTGELGLPEEILVVVPLGRQVLGAADAEAVRAAELGPVLGQERRSCDEEC